MKKGLPLIRGHRALVIKWLFGLWFLYQSSLCRDSKVAPTPSTFHTIKR
jgi:hypothetical protein